MSSISLAAATRYAALATVSIAGAAALALAAQPAQAAQEETHAVVAAQPAEPTTHLDLLYMAAGLSVVGAAVGMGLGEYRHHFAK